MERTFTIIKPDAVANGHTGKIIDRLIQEGFTILGARMTRLSTGQAQGFYAVHKERPFYNDLVAYMTSGPVWVMALERDDAVTALRTVMGATNPENADEGTIRKSFGESIERNAIHGSDSPENAAIELGFFFPTAALL
jgi:nucleoside-diphosphate kinase